MTKTGLLIAHQGVKIVVKSKEDGVLAYSIKRKSDFVVGDSVSIENERPICLPRRNVLKRQTPYGVQSIAANLDGVGIVIAQMPPVPRLFVDQVIMTARSQNICPFIVVNKIDLSAENELLTWVTQTFASTITVLPVSATTGTGLLELRTLLKSLGRSILVGVSGVGKSSLLNALIGSAFQKTSVTVDKDRHGQHTTSQSLLFSLKDGGELIDSPGIRDFSPPELDASEIARLFVGFSEALTRPCHFRNCLHVGEPSCSIKTAVQNGSIQKARYETYLELLTNSEKSSPGRR